MPIPLSMSRDTWGVLPYGSFSGPYNTVEIDVNAYNTICLRVPAEYCSMQGMVPDTVVLTCEPCLAFLRTSPGSYRAGIPGQMALVGTECAGRRRAVSRVPVIPGRRRGVEVISSVLGQAFQSERPSGGGWSRSERSGRRGGPKQPTRGRCSSSARPFGR